jgi:hypothetical protein
MSRMLSIQIRPSLTTVHRGIDDDRVVDRKEERMMPLARLVGVSHL